MEVSKARTCYCCKHIGEKLCLADRCMAWDWYTHYKTNEPSTTEGHCLYMQIYKR